MAKSKQQIVDDFNAAHPVGSPVRLKLDSGEIRSTTVRYAAEVLSGHTPVAWFDGIVGCYDLKCVLP